MKWSLAIVLPLVGIASQTFMTTANGLVQLGVERAEREHEERLAAEAALKASKAENERTLALAATATLVLTFAGPAGAVGDPQTGDRRHHRGGYCRGGRGVGRPTAGAPRLDGAARPGAGRECGDGSHRWVLAARRGQRGRG